MTSLALVSFLICMAYENLFADISLFYLFVVIFALSCAILRTARAECDDLLGYYGDSSSSDSSDLDVSVNG